MFHFDPFRSAFASKLTLTGTAAIASGQLTTLARFFFSE